MATDTTAEQAIADARAICAVAAPPFAEDARADFVAAQLASLGVSVRRDAAGNVIAELPGATDPPVVFAAHLDTVFDAATVIAFEETGDRLYAPGIGDNSLGVAGLLALARQLAGQPLARSVALVATVGEEGLGDLRGAKALVAELPMHAFVAVEGAMADSIVTGGVGSIRLGVTVRGPGGHPWGDRERPSAVRALVQGLAAADDAVHDPDVVFNIGTIAGGTVVNAIAASSTAALDLRCQDDAKLLLVAERIGEALQAVATDDLEVVVEQIGHRPGGAVDADHPLVLAARRARETTGLPPVREDASSTDANAAYGAGIPAITVGITTGGDAHTTREYIDLQPVGGGLRALAALADELVVRGGA
jgi:acetylornithine deacetylase/succinyl-diaminopimelate desuccinylase-like protein